MFEYMPVYKKETAGEIIDRVTRERIAELDIAIYDYECVHYWDLKHGKNHPFRIRERIQMMRSTLTDNIRIRQVCGLPQIER